MTEGRRRAGLGRGLGALLGDIAQEGPDAGQPVQPSGIRVLPIASLTPHPDQPRRYFDTNLLDELTASIASNGLIQPIVVRPNAHGFQIVAGERRWRAAQRAQLHEVPVIVRDLTDAETLEVALLENIQRQDLNAIEEAQAFQRLTDEFGHSQDALAQIVHKSRSHVANLMRLLDLPTSVQQQVIDGTLTMGHARALVGAPDAEGLADEIVARGLSVRQAEKLVRDSRSPQAVQPARRSGGGAPANADTAALERQLADLLGLTVRISHADPGGSVTLDYSNLDQLDMICQRLTGEPI